MTDFVIKPSTVIKGIYVSANPRVNIQFEIEWGRFWNPVDGGIIQNDSRYLAWYKDIQACSGLIKLRGVAKWRLAESTITNPTFQMLCYQSLTIQQQDDALARRAMTDDDRNEIASLWSTLHPDPPVRRRRGLV